MFEGVGVIAREAAGLGVNTAGTVDEGCMAENMSIGLCK